MKTMIMKYPGNCSGCNKALAAGDRAAFQVDESGPRKIWTFWCPDCATTTTAAKPMDFEKPKGDLPIGVPLADLLGSIKGSGVSISTSAPPPVFEPEAGTLEYFKQHAEWR